MAVDPIHPLVERRRARPLLGTRVTIRARGVGQGALDRAIDAAFASVEEIHRLMSFHAAGSDVGRLNRRAYAEPVRVDPRTHAVLAAARAFSAESDGAFDVVVAPGLERSGGVPTSAAEVDPAADWRDVELLAGERVRFRRRLRLDLGGIAKGFAVDQAVASLQRHGLASGLVDAGGDMRAFGSQGFRIALRHPSTGGQAGWWTSLLDRALASSAVGEAAGAAGRPLDPRPMRRGEAPATDIAVPRVSVEADTARSKRVALGHGVAVLAPTALAADALSKVVLFATPALAEAMLAWHGAAAVCLVPAP